MTLFTRRIAALERALAPEPPVRPKSEGILEFEAVLQHVPDADLDLLEQLYRTAADAGFDEPQGADRERALEIMRAAHERRRQAGRRRGDEVPCSDQVSSPTRCWPHRRPWPPA